MKEMTFPPEGEPLVYTDVESGKPVTIRDYELLRNVTYASLVQRTDEARKKRLTEKKAGKTSNRTKRTWYTEHAVLVRRGMVLPKSQGKISKNNEHNLVEIKFVKKSDLPSDSIQYTFDP